MTIENTLWTVLVIGFVWLLMETWVWAFSLSQPRPQSVDHYQLVEELAGGPDSSIDDLIAAACLLAEEEWVRNT